MWKTFNERLLEIPFIGVTTEELERFKKLPQFDTGGKIMDDDLYQTLMQMTEILKGTYFALVDNNNVIIGEAISDNRKPSSASDIAGDLLKYAESAIKLHIITDRETYDAAQIVVVAKVMNLFGIDVCINKTAEFRGGKMVVLEESKKLKDYRALENATVYM